MPQPIPSPGSRAITAIIVREGLTFFGGASGGFWNENSPLPPGARYMELADWYATKASLYSDFPPGNVNVFGLNDKLLPHDSQGRIRRNAKSSNIFASGITFAVLSDLPSGEEIAAELAGIYADDSFWTGEVVDPVNWQDDYWDALLIDRVEMQAYLEAHPGCRLNA